MSLLVSLWVLPGLVAALTPFTYRQVLVPTRDALMTAFITGELFIVLPILTEACRDLVGKLEQADPHSRRLPDVLVPVSMALLTKYDKEYLGIVAETNGPKAGKACEGGGSWEFGAGGKKTDGCASCAEKDGCEQEQNVQATPKGGRA
jgi:hypothetical protein